MALGQPVIVKIVEPTPRDPTGLSDVLIGSLGLSGVLILVSVLLAVVFGAQFAAAMRLEIRFHDKQSFARPLHQSQRCRPLRAMLRCQ